MAVNKNFVVKNGLEVSTDLIFADATTNRVGIASTIPGTELDVIGGIGASTANISGVGTITTLKGTTGIVTTVVGHSVQAGNLNVTGITTIPKLGVLSELYVSGVATVNSLDVITTANIPTGIVTRATGTHLTYTGVSTIGNFIITPDAVGTGATVGAAVGVVTYYGDGANLTNTGGGVGIGSTLGVVGYGFTFINFVGTGNTFKVDGTTVDIGISGGGGGSGSVSIGSEAPASPSSGDLWYSTEYGRTFVWFDEDALGIGDTAVWVDSSPFNNGGQFLSKYGDNAYGAIGYTGGTTAQASIYFTGDPNTGLIQPAADHVNIVAGGTKSLEVNPSGISVVGVITGDGSGLTGVASTDNIITTTEAKLLGGVRMEGFTTSATMNVTGVTTLRDDITLTGSQAGVTSVFYDASGDVLRFNDNVKASFGNGSDLSIFHNGTNNTVSITNGNLTIAKGASENIAKFTPDGSIDLYYDNTKRFETASDDKGGGVIVTGKIVGTAATIGTGVTINNTGIDAGIGAGIITASTYHGDGSNLTGIAAGGSGEFNTSISGATQYDVTTSMAVAFTANASSSHRTIVHSIHICNITGSEASISGEIQSSFSLAHTIPVPAGSAVELLKQPKVLGPSETIELQSDTASALEATIIIEYKEDTDYWDAAIDLTSAATLTDIYTSTTNPSVVQSILLANDDGTNDVKARVAWTDGSDNIQSYLVYDMIIPADATVEICEKPKYLAAGYKLRGYANVADRLEITASGKQITS
jgi:hypothetical protein